MRIYANQMDQKSGTLVEFLSEDKIIIYCYSIRVIDYTQTFVNISNKTKVKLRLLHLSLQNQRLNVDFLSKMRTHNNRWL